MPQRHSKGNCPTSSLADRILPVAADDNPTRPCMLCYAIMQKGCIKRSAQSKNYTSRIQEVNKGFGCKWNQGMPMSVIKQTTTSAVDAMQCKMQKFVTHHASQPGGRLLEVGRHALVVVVAPLLASRAVGAGLLGGVAAAAARPDGCYGGRAVSSCAAACA